MSTSVHTGIVEFAASLYGTDDDPISAHIWRDGVANGLLHAADSQGQVRVNALWLDSGISNSIDNHATIETPDTAEQWYLVEGSPFGRWPITVRADGTPYRLRLRIGGALSTGTGTCTWRVVIAPSYTEALSGRTQYGDHIFQAATTSTTVAWMTGTSQGDFGNATFVDVTAEQAAAWMSTETVHDAVSGASETEVNQVLVSAWVWAKVSTTAGGMMPNMHGLYIAEHLAP